MDRPLRFCMITTFYPPYNFGGDGVFVHQLSNELARRGHHVDVIHCIDAYRLLAEREPAKSYEDHPNVTVHGLRSRTGLFLRLRLNRRAILFLSRPASTQQPWISVIIDTYNYGSFLSEAIESVLAQTYPKTEVIVVDDGSTDNSRQIITKYDDQIVAVLKDNRGQASAFDAGFLRSRGGIVVFLDADDILLPDTAGQIAETFQCHPHIARIQYRLAVIDRSGAPRGAVAPPAYIGMLGGDLRRHISELNNYAAWWPTTSGDALLAEKVVHPETRPSLHKLFSVR